MADATRAGHAEQAAYSRWRLGVLRSARQVEANPAALEAGVMALARSHPEYVVMEGI